MKRSAGRLSDSEQGLHVEAVAGMIIYIVGMVLRVEIRKEENPEVFLLLLIIMCFTRK